MKDHVHIFYQNEAQREAVKAYMLAIMDREALKTVYDKGDTSAIAEARRVIKKSFSQMAEDYDDEKPKLQGNKAR